MGEGPTGAKVTKPFCPTPPHPLCGTAMRQNQTLAQCVRTWPSQPCPIFSPRQWQQRMCQKMAWSPLGFQLHVKEMAKFPWIAHYALLNVNLTKNPFDVTHMLTEAWVQHSTDTLTDNPFYKSTLVFDSRLGVVPYFNAPKHGLMATYARIPQCLV